MKLETIIATRPKKTVYRDGDVVIKLFNEDYSKSDILNEALNQARVEETGLAIPKILEITKIDVRVCGTESKMEAKSVSARGVALLPAPTNPVTPRVFLTIYQVSSVISILTRT